MHVNNKERQVEAQSSQRNHSRTVFFRCQFDIPTAILLPCFFNKYSPLRIIDKMKIFILFVVAITMVAGDNKHGHQHDHHNHHHHDAHPQEDHHLHDSQIPSPDNMPSHEDVAAMLNEVFALIDKDSNDKISGEELKNWLDKIHKDT